jgi:flagellar biosynthesis/type III secretory pathway ATPase
MKPGRVIDGDEHDARVLGQQLLADARREAQEILDAAKVEAERVTAKAAAGAAAIRQQAGIVSSETPSGRVEAVTGLVIRASLANVALGEIVMIDRGGSPLRAEVVGFSGEQAVLLPLGELAGIAPASPIWRTGEPLTIRCGDDLLGRVLDGVGQPSDGGAAITGETWEVDRPAPNALARPPISAHLATGVRAIDSLLTLAWACLRRRASASRHCSRRSRAARMRT